MAKKKTATVKKQKLDKRYVIIADFENWKDASFVNYDSIYTSLASAEEAAAELSDDTLVSIVELTLVKKGNIKRQIAWEK